MTTYEHAKRVNGGKVFRDAEGNRAIYSDRSDGARKAFGYLLWADGTQGAYQELPDNMFPERYNVTTAHDFARRIKQMGFVVYLAAQGHYGFFTDDAGDHVVSFQFGLEDTLSGNYGPPSRDSGTGWRMETSPHALRTAEDVRRVINAHPPLWCGKGWKHKTSLAAHLKMYGGSSHYREVPAAAPVRCVRGNANYGAMLLAARDPHQVASEVTAEEYEDMLGCVPPIYVEGVPGFLVGEALTSDAGGAVHANYFISRDGLYCARYYYLERK